MPFSNYKNIDTVAQEFQIQYIYANFVNEIKLSVNHNFRAVVNYVFQQCLLELEKSEKKL